MQAVHEGYGRKEDVGRNHSDQGHWNRKVDLVLMRLSTIDVVKVAHERFMFFFGTCNRMKRRKMMSGKLSAKSLRNNPTRFTLL